MKKLGLAAAACALGLGLTLGAGIVPATVGKAIAASKQERSARRSAIRAKRLECRREADAQKLRFIKRSRFLRACNRRS